MPLEDAELRATARCACATGAMHQHAIQGVRRRLVPLIAIAWSDGSIDAKERAAVLAKSPSGDFMREYRAF
jgi:uncharacterized membrane protein YebE (DUF533 family)